MKCRICESSVNQVFVDLGRQPASNAYLTAERLSLPEPTYPLRVYVCNECWLVQLPAHASSEELFTDSYAYFSSVSSSWVEHARRYAREMVERFALDTGSSVVEIASNDGYLLQFFKERGIPCLGIEPTASTAEVAREKGIETLEEFFGSAFAEQLVERAGRASLLIGNNVLAHVPELNDFVAGIAIALAEGGVATFEFPHLMQLVEGRQFDTIYHEHYSYLALYTVARLFRAHGLRVFDVQELPTHGGSLRVFACHDAASEHTTSPRVDELLAREAALGMQTSAYYAGFQSAVETIKDGLLQFLEARKQAGELVAGYGAAAKGNTLMNYAHVTRDHVPFVCDAAPSKQGKYLPGSRIPILAPKVLKQRRPDVVLILPWNIADEVVAQHSYVEEWGGRFVVALPEIRIIENRA